MVPLRLVVYVCCLTLLYEPENIANRFTAKYGRPFFNPMKKQTFNHQLILQWYENGFWQWIVALNNQDVASGSFNINLICVSVLQCAVKYEITGDGLATSLFSINEDSGVILLDEPFTIDVGTLYVVRLAKVLSNFIGLKIYIFCTWKTWQKSCSLQ